MKSGFKKHKKHEVIVFFVWTRRRKMKIVDILCKKKVIKSENQGLDSKYRSVQIQVK